MTQRAWILKVVAVSAILSTGCSTLPRAREASAAEEVDMLADVQLSASERAAIDEAPGAGGPAQRENSTEISWQPNGKNIQLAKLPPVTPVTASMLQLDKRNRLLAPGPKAAADEAPPARGRHKSSPGKE
jgi:hypothetical protein